MAEDRGELGLRGKDPVLALKIAAIVPGEVLTDLESALDALHGLLRLVQADRLVFAKELPFAHEGEAVCLQPAGGLLTSLGFQQANRLARRFQGFVQIASRTVSRRHNYECRPRLRGPVGGVRNLNRAVRDSYGL